MMLPKMSAGDSLYNGPARARNWNPVVDATNHYLKHVAGGERLPQLDLQQNWHSKAWARNDTTNDLRAGEVVEFDGFDFSEVTNYTMMFHGVTPDLTNVGWGITLEDAKYNATSPNYAPCAVAGLVAAYVNVTNTNHTHAKLVSGSRVLDSAASGPVQIFHKPSGTGEKFCAVLIGVPSLKVYIGKTDATLSKGSSATVSRWTGGGSESDTGTNDTVKNLFANVASGKWVAYVDVDGTFYAIAAEC